MGRFQSAASLVDLVGKPKVPEEAKLTVLATSDVGEVGRLTMQYGWGWGLGTHDVGCLWEKSESVPQIVLDACMYCTVCICRVQY
jgi:hypothetical protein